MNLASSSLRVLSFAAVVVGVVSSSGTARADERDVSAHDDAPAHASDLLVTGAVGVFEDGSVGGPALSLSAIHQRAWLGYGATFEAGATFGYTHVTAAPMVGVFVPGPRWLRAGLAGTAGVHAYDVDGGGTSTLGFVGARAIAGVELGRSARFHVGVQLSLDDDLARQRVSYTTRERPSSFFQDTSSLPDRIERHEGTIGFVRASGMLAFGGAFDL